MKQQTLDQTYEHSRTYRTTLTLLCVSRSGAVAPNGQVGASHCCCCQVEGVRWLWGLHKMQRGGILGDDMGCEPLIV